MKSAMFLTGLLVGSTAPAVRAQADHTGHSPRGQTVRLFDNLGTHHYAITTTNPRAQKFFDQGLRLSYAFNHEEAVRSFAEGERLDSTCAMCAWGVAYALGPNINAPMSAEAEHRAAAAARRALAGSSRVTPAERALIGAMAVRYAPEADAEGRAARDSAYADSLRLAAAAFPDDDEVLTLYAEALMDLSPWVYWERDSSPRPATPAILSSLETVQRRNPDHPGACHFYIHLVEAVYPERAVPCAERLASLMPGAGHIVHMPGHIYIRVGRWLDAVEANRHAVHADEQYFEGPGASRLNLYGQGYAPHNWHFMTFAATMAGQSAVALGAARRTTDAIDPDIARVEPLAEALIPVAVTTAITFGRWQDALAEPLPDPALRYASGMAWYARGIAHAANGRFREAALALDSVTAISDEYPVPEMHAALGVAREVLRGEIELRRGNVDSAVSIFRRATELEDAISYMEPPWWYYPVRHSLGKALLLAGRPDEAERAYREDLVRFPNNGWSLFGLAKSLEAQGRRADAERAWQRFRSTWAEADIALETSRF